MTTAETNPTDKAAAVAAQGAHVAPEKATAKMAASQKRRAQGQESRQGWQSRGRRTEEGCQAKREGQQESRQVRPTGRRPACRKQGREDPGDDRPRQGCHARRDHEGHRLAGSQRPRLHLDREQEARHQDRVG
jgi:hypothetical protein